MEDQEYPKIYRVTSLEDNPEKAPADRRRFQRYCGQDRLKARTVYHRCVGGDQAPKLEIISDAGTDDFDDDEVEEVEEVEK